MYEHSHSQSVSVGSGSIGGGAKKYQGSGQVRIDETIANGDTDKAVNFTLDVSTLKSIVILSDRALTLETNSSSAPTNTIVLKAGVPYVWNTDSYDTCKITADVTSLFVTNGTGASARLQIDAVTDVTP